MNLKNDLKKLEKSLRTTKKKVVKKYHKYLRAQKLSRGDVVFGLSLCLVFLITLGIIGRFTMEIGTPNNLKEANSLYGVVENRTPNPTLRSIVFGVQETEAKNVAQAKVPNPATLNLPIMMYHRVDNVLIPGDKSAYSLTVPTDNFEAQLAYLRDNGYATIGFDDLYKAFYENTPLPSKSVLLTFDDGYEDNYLLAFPLLKKYGLKATFFVATAFTDNNRYYMTAEQLKEMSAAGMNIESHTLTHPDLTKLPVQRLQAELVNSKKTLEQITGKDVFFFAYPFGAYNPAVALETKNAGYLMAVTTKVGKIQNGKDPYGLVRFYVSPATTLTSFANWVSH